MKKIEKIFGGLNMSWIAVIIFALAAGAITGVFASIPSIKDTSLGDITGTYEWWLIFAFVIASNCKKNWESALKIFVFFLISQPLVFGVEILTGALDFSKAWYYYSSIWGPATLFTLPGGFIAYYINKQNILGAIILGLGNAILGFMGTHYLLAMVQNPPFHLITTIVCFASIFLMTFSIQQDNKNRLISLLIAAIVTGGIVILALTQGRVL